MMSTALVALACSVSLAQTEPPPFEPLRYEEDWSYLRDASLRSGPLDRLKYIPFDQDGDFYLSFGGEIREQYEYYRNLDFGQAPEDEDGYLLQRYMLHGDFHLGPSFRLFGELKSNLVTDQDGAPGPADEDRLDLHQAFGDAKLELGPESALTLRLGRQEMLYGSQRLISVREGPNARRSFDAARVLSTLGAWKVDAFVSRPVETDPGLFDDWGEDDASLWGIYATSPLSSIREAVTDFYYLGLSRPHAEFDAGTEDEVRHSIGTRFFGKPSGLDFNFEAVFQAGTFGTDAILAWTVASDTGYTLASLPLTPRLGLRANVISGDSDPDDSVLETFNPLYPRGNYFGESALIGPVNLMNAHPIIQFHLPWSVGLEVGCDFFFRYSRRDGVYGNGVNLIRSGAGSDARFIGSELSAVLDWEFARHFLLGVAYSHFFAGEFLRETEPGEDVDYVGVKLSFKF